MTNNITVKVSELPGQLGHLKASKLAHLLEAYTVKHPEIDEAVKRKAEEATHGLPNHP